MSKRTVKSKLVDSWLLKLDQELDQSEIKLIDRKVLPVEELEIYVRHLHSIHQCIFNPEDSIGCSLWRGLRGIGRAAKRLRETTPKKEKPKPKLLNSETQTDNIVQEQSPELLISQLEDLAGIQKKTEKSSLKKIIILLRHLYANLKRMKTDVPEPTVIPEIYEGDLQNLTRDLERSYKVIKHEILSSTASPEKFCLKSDKSSQAKIKERNNEIDEYIQIVKEKELEIMNLKGILKEKDCKVNSKSSQLSLEKTEVIRICSSKNFSSSHKVPMHNHNIENLTNCQVLILSKKIKHKRKLKDKFYKIQEGSMNRNDKVFVIKKRNVDGRASSLQNSNELQDNNQSPTKFPKIKTPSQSKDLDTSKGSINPYVKYNKTEEIRKYDKVALASGRDEAYRIKSNSKDIDEKVRNRTVNLNNKNLSPDFFKRKDKKIFNQEKTNMMKNYHENQLEYFKRYMNPSDLSDFNEVQTNHNTSYDSIKSNGNKKIDRILSNFLLCPQQDALNKDLKKINTTSQVLFQREVFENLAPKAKLNIYKELMKHSKQCGNDGTICKHLLRVCEIKEKYSGRPYPIKKFTYNIQV